MTATKRDIDIAVRKAKGEIKKAYDDRVKDAGAVAKAAEKAAKEALSKVESVKSASTAAAQKAAEAISKHATEIGSDISTSINNSESAFRRARAADDRVDELRADFNRRLEQANTAMTAAVEEAKNEFAASAQRMAYDVKVLEEALRREMSQLSGNVDERLSGTERRVNSAHEAATEARDVANSLVD